MRHPGAAMAIPSGWRGERGRRGSPMSGSASEDEGPPLPHRSALDPRNGGDQRRPYSPVAETVRARPAHSFTSNIFICFLLAASSIF